MNPLLENDDDLLGRREREVTLSTGAILGIFFGLVLICGVFFGFGYNLGRKSNPLPASAITTPQGAQPSADFDAFKPPAGSPSSNAPSSAANQVPTAAPIPTSPSSADNAAPASGQAASTAPQAVAVAQPAPASNAPAPQPPVSAPVQTVGPAPAGSFVVQIAAVSHPEDANLLVSALRGRGYDVAARRVPQDNLIHIQVGPFSNHADAEAMRQRLLADGYNAIVK